MKVQMTMLGFFSWIATFLLLEIIVFYTAKYVGWEEGYIEASSECRENL